MTASIRRCALPTMLALAVLGLTEPRAAHAQQPVAPAASAVPRTEAHEEFREFLARFSRDTAFQRSRVRFPLPWYSAADDTTHRYTARSWTHATFYDGQEAFPQLFDNFAMRLADTDERVYALIGVASDVRQNWFFRRLQGRWFLVKVEDLSM